MTTFVYSLPVVNGSEDTWGETLNTNWTNIGTFLGALDSAELAKLDGLTASQAELNILDGLTASTAELNILDGVTASTAELNILDGVTSTTAELNILDGVTSTTAELNILDGVTATAVELNKMDGVTSTTAELNILDGVTATAVEINRLDGMTATAAELNKMDGCTATTTELNYTDGVTSNIQTQLNAKAASARTISAGGGLTGGGNLTINRTISHSNTSSQASVNNSGSVYIQDISVDTYGHVTSISSTTVPSDITKTSGSAPYYGCRAWGKISGNAKVAGGNFSSWTASTNRVTFTTAMPTANYSVNCNSKDGAGNIFVNNMTTTGFVINVRSSSGNVGDPANAEFTVIC